MCFATRRRSEHFASSVKIRDWIAVAVDDLQALVDGKARVRFQSPRLRAHGIKGPALDLGYRPESYFWPITHETHRIAAIKDERRRNIVREAFDANTGL